MNLRREKLRALLLEEEAILTREIIEKAQKSNDGYLENLKKRTEEAQRRQEEKRLALLKAKRTQQYLARCPEARERFVKKSTQDVKYCNLVQMAENNAQREAEKELEMMWHGLMLKEVICNFIVASYDPIRFKPNIAINFQITKSVALEKIICSNFQNFLFLNINIVS